MNNNDIFKNKSMAELDVLRNTKINQINRIKNEVFETPSISAGSSVHSNSYTGISYDMVQDESRILYKGMLIPHLHIFW